MKRLITITGSLLFICIILSFYRRSYGAGAQANRTDALSVSDTAPVSDAVTDRDGGFTVKAYNGSIAVFRGNESEPYFVSEVRLSTLPPYDRSLLENGIAAPDKKSLDRLLRDYLS